MSAKSELLGRLKYLNVALESTDVINIGLSSDGHNGAANLLRKGLGIVAFNILEDFIKAKSVEALDNISASGMQYSNLPEKLQEATTLGALKALTFRAKIEKKDGGDWMTMIHDESKKIHSTCTESYTLSKYSFVSENSNVNADEIVHMMKAFKITGGWGKLKSISDDIFGGVPDLCNSYTNASERRHNAAHVANFEYEYTWLSNIQVEILSIAASIDILLTALCRLINTNPAVRLENHNIDSALNYRFLVLDLGSGLYKEKLNPTARSIKNWPTLDTGINSIQPRLKSRNEFLIILNHSLRIMDWYY